MLRVFRNISIRRKLMVLTMSTSGAVLLLVTLAFAVNEIITFRRAIRQELTALANIIGMNTTAAITFDDRKSAEVALQGLETNTHILAALILKSDGTVFAKYRAPGAETNNLTSEPYSSSEWRLALTRNFEVWTPIFQDNQQIGTVVIWAGTSELMSRLASFLVIVSIIMIAALVIAYALSAKLQGPIANSVVRLAQTMRAVTEGKNYALRAEKQSSDEIGQLIDGFNDMLSQIQKQDEDLEHIASELKESNEELKAFIYSAAHDLRQPLVNIKGFTHELDRSLQDIRAILRRNAECLPENDRNRIDAVFEDDIQAATGFVGSSVERMASLIDALLKLSQVGSRILRPEPFSMESLVRSSIRSLGREIEEKNITVIVGDLPDVTADRMAFEQIMGNLLDNAVKYLADARPGRIEISGERTKTGVIYRVRDNGRGIAVDDIPKVFDVFRRVGTQKVPGIGVGLAFVRTLVRMHGGRIWCESYVGTGSTFSFLIPLGHHPPQSQQEKA